MKNPVPQLTPFVRSDAVGAILAEVLTHPERELSLAELGRRTGVSGPVVHKEVSRLVESDIVVDRIEGRSRLIRANQDHLLFKPMRDIILAAYGPVPVLRELFQDVPDVSQALIYGSWAARRAGISGPYPGDIDVLVVGDTPRRTLSKLAARASERLGVQVNIMRLPLKDWEAEDPTPFVSAVKSRPVFSFRHRNRFADKKIETRCGGEVGNSRR